MKISLDDADEIFKANKRLLPPLRWQTVDSKNSNEQRRKLECRLEVGGGVRRGVFFRIIVYPRSLVRATFQLECDMPSGRAHVPLYRLELSPVRPHINKTYGPSEISGLRIPAGQTHEHVFYDSVKNDGGLRENACEQARIVNPEPLDFASALEQVCSRINVLNGYDVPNPGDQGMLL